MANKATYGYQKGGAAKACPSACEIPNLQAANENTAIANNNYRESDGQTGCKGCALFDIAKRMKSCVDKEEGVGYCWKNHFKCSAGMTCDSFEEGGPIEDDSASYAMQAKYLEEALSKEPVLSNEPADPPIPGVEPQGPQGARPVPQSMAQPPQPMMPPMSPQGMPPMEAPTFQYGGLNDFIYQDGTETDGDQSEVWGSEDFYKKYPGFSGQNISNEDYQGPQRKNVPSPVPHISRFAGVGDTNMLDVFAAVSGTVDSFKGENFIETDPESYERKSWTNTTDEDMYVNPQTGKMMTEDEKTQYYTGQMLDQRSALAPELFGQRTYNQETGEWNLEGDPTLEGDIAEAANPDADYLGFRMKDIDPTSQEFKDDPWGLENVLTQDDEGDLTHTSGQTYTASTYEGMDDHLTVDDDPYSTYELPTQRHGGAAESVLKRFISKAQLGSENLNEYGVRQRRRSPRSQMDVKNPISHYQGGGNLYTSQTENPPDQTEPYLEQEREYTRGAWGGWGYGDVDHGAMDYEPQIQPRNVVEEEDLPATDPCPPCNGVVPERVDGDCPVCEEEIIDNEEETIVEEDDDSTPGGKRTTNQWATDTYNKGRRFMDSKGMQIFDKTAAGIVNIGKPVNRMLEQRQERKRLEGMKRWTLGDNQFAVAEDEGNRGDTDVNTGARFQNKRVRSRQGKYGTELNKLIYQDGGEDYDKLISEDMIVDPDVLDYYNWHYQLNDDNRFAEGDTLWHQVFSDINYPGYAYSMASDQHGERDDIPLGWFTHEDIPLVGQGDDRKILNPAVDPYLKENELYQHQEDNPHLYNSPFYSDNYAKIDNTNVYLPEFGIDTQGLHEYSNAPPVLPGPNSSKYFNPENSNHIRQEQELIDEHNKHATQIEPWLKSPITLLSDPEQAWKDFKSAPVVNLFTGEEYSDNPDQIKGDLCPPGYTRRYDGSCVPDSYWSEEENDWVDSEFMMKDAQQDINRLIFKKNLTRNPFKKLTIDNFTDEEKEQYGITEETLKYHNQMPTSIRQIADQTSGMYDNISLSSDDNIFGVSSQDIFGEDSGWNSAVDIGQWFTPMAAPLWYSYLAEEIPAGLAESWETGSPAPLVNKAADLAAWMGAWKYGMKGVNSVWNKALGPAVKKGWQMFNGPHAKTLRTGLGNAARGANALAFLDFMHGVGKGDVSDTWVGKNVLSPIGNIMDKMPKDYRDWGGDLYSGWGGGGYEQSESPYCLFFGIGCGSSGNTTKSSTMGAPEVDGMSGETILNKEAQLEFDKMIRNQDLTEDQIETLDIPEHMYWTGSDWATKENYPEKSFNYDKSGIPTEEKYNIDVGNTNYKGFYLDGNWHIEDVQTGQTFFNPNVNENQMEEAIGNLEQGNMEGYYPIYAGHHADKLYETPEFYTDPESKWSKKKRKDMPYEGIPISEYKKQGGGDFDPIDPFSPKNMEINNQMLNQYPNFAIPFDPESNEHISPDVLNRLKNQFDQRGLQGGIPMDTIPTNKLQGGGDFGNLIRNNAISRGAGVLAGGTAGMMTGLGFGAAGILKGHADLPNLVGEETAESLETGAYGNQNNVQGTFFGSMKQDGGRTQQLRNRQYDDGDQHLNDLDLDQNTIQELIAAGAEIEFI